jgi:transposase
MLPSAVSDLTAELERGWPAQPTPRSGPAQPQPPRARQAELVICGKAIERSIAWFGQSRRLARDHERLPETGEAMIHAAMGRIMLRRVAT